MKSLMVLVCLNVLFQSGSNLEVVKEFEMGIQDEMTNASAERELLMSLNPGCPVESCFPNSTVMTVANFTVTDLHAKKENDDDDEEASRHHHWIWTMIDRPAMQVALTKKDDIAVVNWPALLGAESLDSAIQYQNIPDYSAAIMLANLIEYNDASNLGYLDPTVQDVIVYPMLNFAWNRTIIENTTERVAFKFIAENYTATEGAKFNITGGKLNITFSAYAYHGFGHWLPHLDHSESTNHIDIQLQKLESNSNFNFSRYALEFYLVSNAEKRTNLVRQNTKTLDDEHTPGIFTTQELVIPGYNDSLQAYLQWRPVVYTSMARDLSSSTDVNITRDITVEDPQMELKKTILFAFYGQDLGNMMVRKINVTMGSKGDGFYKKTKYQAWAFSFGTGTPIHNGMSPMIVLVITVMFGVLAIVLLTSCVVCAIKKVKKRKMNYGRIEED